MWAGQESGAALTLLCQLTGVHKAGLCGGQGPAFWLGKGPAQGFQVKLEDLLQPGPPARPVVPTLCFCVMETGCGAQGRSCEGTGQTEHRTVQELRAGT